MTVAASLGRAAVMDTRWAAAWHSPSCGKWGVAKARTLLCSIDGCQPVDNFGCMLRLQQHYGAGRPKWLFWTVLLSGVATGYSILMMALRFS